MVILEIKGKQYPAEEGDTLRVDRINLEPGKPFADIKVLFYRRGDQIQVGKPFLENVKVTSKVENEYKDKKVKVVHYKPKKDIRSLQGHRQRYTYIKIERIEAA